MQWKNKKYKISIIIPNYNGEKFIEWCLKSILFQSYDHYEIIIVDGKSKDGSHEIIEIYQKQFSDKITWLKVHDTGISNGFNLGIEVARGDFVLLLGSDDYLYDGILQKLNTFISTISEYKDVEIEKCNFYCDSINYWSPKKQFIKRIPQTDIFSKKNLVKYGNISWFQNIYINRWWFQNFRINEKNKYSMDYETYFEMLKNNETFIHFPEINSINHLWDNTTCKYWYQSQKEANNIAFKNISNVIWYFYVFKRFFMREMLRLVKWTH